MKHSPYSFSKISCYTSCNRKFKYKYIDKIPTESFDDSALIKGSNIHDTLEHYPNHKINEHTQIALDFINSELGQKYINNERESEIEFGLTENFEPTSYRSKDAIIKGKIDCIVVVDGNVYVLDWKSGKYKEEKYQSYEQVIIYAIYIFQRYQYINELNLAYVYVEHGLENKFIAKREYLDNYINMIKSNIEMIERDEYFNKSVSVLCKWCEYSEYCEKDINI